MTETDYINAALEQAREAAARDEVPIGAVLVNAETGEIVARNSNRTLELRDRGKAESAAGAAWRVF